MTPKTNVYGDVQLLDTAGGSRVEGWTYGEMQGRVTFTSHGALREQVATSQAELVALLASIDRSDSLKLLTARLEPLPEPVPEPPPTADWPVW